MMLRPILLVGGCIAAVAVMVPKPEPIPTPAPMAMAVPAAAAAQPAAPGAPRPGARVSEPRPIGGRAGSPARAQCVVVGDLAASIADARIRGVPRERMLQIARDSAPKGVVQPMIDLVETLWRLPLHSISPATARAAAERGCRS